MVASQRRRATNQVGLRMRWHDAIAECDQGTNEMVVVACVRGARPSSTANYLRNSNGQVKYFKQDTWFLSVVFGFCVSRVAVALVVCVCVCVCVCVGMVILRGWNGLCIIKPNR